VRGAVIFVLVLATVSPFLTKTSSAAERRIEITAKRWKFTPSEITVQKGEPVVLVLKSQDVSHGITIPALGVEAEFGKGKATEVPFTAQYGGDFIGRCNHFCGTGHGQMRLTVHVSE
jgi:cytochrome c oxidase subunit II